MKTARYSKQRENIKKGLELHCIHPTAEELYMKLKPDNQNLSLATVYRNLNYLAEKGDIKKIEGLSGKVHFDHNNHEHFHMICTKCNKIFDLPAKMAESLKEVLNNQDEFEVLSYEINVRGICKHCRDNKNK